MDCSNNQKNGRPVNASALRRSAVGALALAWVDRKYVETCRREAKAESEPPSSAPGKKKGARRRKKGSPSSVGGKGSSSPRKIINYSGDCSMVAANEWEDPAV